MTEQEAIEIIKGIDEVRGNLPEDGNDVEIALMMAKDALEEIQQYRAYEERLKKIYGDCPGLLEIVVKHLEAHEGVDLPEPNFLRHKIFLQPHLAHRKNSGKQGKSRFRRNRIYS